MTKYIKFLKIIYILQLLANCILKRKIVQISLYYVCKKLILHIYKIFKIIKFYIYTYCHNIQNVSFDSKQLIMLTILVFYEIKLIN